jgi:FMN-dependent NADH-azoreductase
MPNLLHLDSSADLATSRSRAITAAFAKAWTGRGDDFVVTYRDLHREPLPHLPDPALHWAPALRTDGEHPPAADEARQQEVLAELLAADVLLIGAPMYNYSLPSTLKAWIDHVHVLGTTATIDPDNPSQPLAGRPVVVATSCGATYGPGAPSEGWDHATPVLELILGTAMGMTMSVIGTDLTLATRLSVMSKLIPVSETHFNDALATAAELAGTIV